MYKNKVRFIFCCQFLTDHRCRSITIMKIFFVIFGFILVFGFTQAVPTDLPTIASSEDEFLNDDEFLTELDLKHLDKALHAIAMIGQSYMETWKQNRILPRKIITPRPWSLFDPFTPFWNNVEGPRITSKPFKPSHFRIIGWNKYSNIIKPTILYVN